MVTQCHRPEERNKVQSFNDFLIFGTMALGSFASGKLLAHGGLGVRSTASCFRRCWSRPLLLVWLTLRERRRGYPV